uniref:Uncharacterized protein n=1 Tax=Nicotiana tabacum TaxID=4097 RepID=A0A1S4A1J3_TOBAC|nr:PREDICTED: uncharacterized protein LOC107792754 [Nicotiana tabacum]
MRPAPPGQKIKPSNPKSEKDNKRKRVSKPEDPQDKKTPLEDDEENDDEDSTLVIRTKKPIQAAKPSELETSSCGEETPKEGAGKAPVSPEVDMVPLSSTTRKGEDEGYADKSISIYLREAVAVQVELREASDRGKRSNELAKCQARRETLQEIHARGFNLAEEIAEAKTRETDDRFLVSSDDEDVASGSGDEEGEKYVPERDETPEDRAAEDVVSEDDISGGVTSKID